MSKNKNEVMIDVLNDSLSKSLELSNKYKMLDEDISCEEREINSGLLLMDNLPMIIAYNQIGYENAKDLEDVDRKKSRELFNTNGKILYLLAIYDFNGVSFPDFRSEEVIDLIKDGESVSDILFESVNNFNKYDKDRIMDVFLHEFDFLDLYDEDVEMIEEYHKKFMDINVNPFVTDESKTDSLKVYEKVNNNKSFFE